jgi:hypothetical protein
MFSWHPLKNGKAHEYARGFKYLESNEFDDEYTFEYLERALTTRVWSPILFTNGIRTETNFKAVLACALDFDSPVTTLDWALETFKNHAHIIGTTKSHQKEKKGITCDRFRVVLLFNEIIKDLNLYKYNMGILTTKYNADKACKDGARFFFPCTEIVSRGNGVFVDVSTPRIVPQEKDIRRSGHGFKTFVKVRPASENRNESVLKEGIKMFMSNMARSEIIPMLRIVSNGLPEKEFERTVQRAEMYALSKK